MGDAWLTSRRSRLLKVPSVVVPLETNRLINPRHPSAGQFRIINTTKFVYDSRIRP
ncbi:RES family NAD+ phosphorylase [Asticcacaulis sp. AC402]|uniref:RES family NAD+ phosphorylase n=1 Tax=Asticcacaulis sp. AC402 TaxID=1282361 RepID=UPI0004269AA9